MVLYRKLSLSAANGAEILVFPESSAAVRAEAGNAFLLGGDDGLNRGSHIHSNRAGGLVDGEILVVTQGGSASGAIDEAVSIPGSEIQLVVHICNLGAAISAGLDIGKAAVPRCAFESHSLFSFLLLIPF